jgi:hypothetical protein
LNNLLLLFIIYYVAYSNRCWTNSLPGDGGVSAVRAAKAYMAVITRAARLAAHTNGAALFTRRPYITASIQFASAGLMYARKNNCQITSLSASRPPSHFAPYRRLNTGENGARPGERPRIVTDRDTGLFSKNGLVIS